MSRSLKADQVAAAFSSVPGIVVTAIDKSPTGTQDISGTSYTDITEGTADFEVPVAGDYMLRFYAWGTYNYPSTVGGGRYQIRITGATTWTSSDTPQLSVGNEGDNRNQCSTSIGPLTMNAGSHTIQLAWKRLDSATCRFDHYLRFNAYLEMVSGSGAGGTLVSVKEDSVDRTHTGAGTFTAIAALTHTFTTFEGESVHLSAVYNAYLVSGGATSLYSGYRVDEGSWVKTARASVPGSGRARNMAFSTAIEGLSAGSHTVELGFGGDSADTIRLDNDQSAAQSTLTQYRGGQIPWEIDGTEVASTPRAINIDGATVDYSVDDGKLNLSLPKAVTAEGYGDTSVAPIPGGFVSINSGTWTEFYSQTVVPTVVGLHRVDISFTTYAFGSSNSRFDFKVVFDEGGDDEVTIPASADEGAWYWRQDPFGYYKQHNYADFALLAAKSQTAKIYGRRQDGGYTLNVAGNQEVQLLLTAVTGSGAGGTLLAESLLSANQAIADGSITTISGLELTFETAHEETVDVGYQIFFNASGGNWARVVLARIDAGSWICLESENGADTTCHVGSYQFSGLSAGSHTVEFAGELSGITGTVFATNLIWGHTMQSRSWVTQYRGGLVPITDGYTTVDKPIAQEFINASVTESGGKAIVSLPQAVTTLGESIEIYSDAPSSGQTLDQDAWTDVPGISEGAFTVSQAGKFKLDVLAHVCNNTTVNSIYTAQYRLVFDAAGESQTVGGDDAWEGNAGRYTSAIGEETRITVSAYVELAVGDHTVKFQYRRTSGTNSPRLFGSAQTFKIWATTVTGSGAGGALLGTSTLGSNQSVSSTANPPTAIIPTMDSLVINCTPGEIIRLACIGNGAMGGTASATLARFAVDGTPLFSGNRWNWSVPAVFSYQIAFEESFVATASQHTITLLMSCLNTTCTIYAGLQVAAWQARGGLVPHKNDNVLVQDKPVAVNYLGPGLQATDVGGQVNVSAQLATEGLNFNSDTLSASYAFTDSWADVGISTDIDVAEGETILVSFVGTIFTQDVNNYGYLKLVSDIDGDVYEWPTMATTATTYAMQNVSIAFPLSGLTAGTHTIKVQGYRYSANVVKLAGGSKLLLTRVRGGYTISENVPKLEYSSASVVNCVKQPGASDRFWLVLSDGKRYYADGTQTIDLTASGLGGLDTGSEASSTWYYCYAVPTSSTSSVFDVVASVTDPDSGGPTGYDAWKWLGAIYNSSSGNIRDFIQVGEWFYPLSQSSDHTLYYSDATPTGSWVNVSTNLAVACPVAVADAVLVNSWTDGDAGQVNRCWVEPGNPPGWTPTDSTEFASGAAISVQNDSQDTNARIIPIPDGTLSFYMLAVAGSGSINSSFRSMGWRASRLMGAPTQTQAQYQPDTKRIVLTYASATQVTVSPRGGTAIRLTLQDGKQRTVSSAVGFNPSLGAADGGLDTGTEASDTWYYVYLVPKSGDDNSLAVRGSTSPPATGPTGYSNYWYVGPVRNGAGSDFFEFTQVGLDRFRYRDLHTVYSNTAPPTSWTALDLSGDLPATCQVARMAVGLVYVNSGSGGTETLEIRRTGDTNTSRQFIFDVQSSDPHGDTAETDIEVNGSRSLDHKWTRNETFSSCEYYITEFTDDYAGEATQ